MLNLIDGSKGFPRLLGIEINSPNYTIVMTNTGDRITGRVDNPAKKFVQLLKLVATLHANHIVHCDIKPWNVTVNGETGELSVIDFTHSYLSEPSAYDHKGRHESICAQRVTSTRMYAAPETLAWTSCSNESSEITSAIDVWSAACVFFYMVTGSELFSGSGAADNDAEDIASVIRQHRSMDITLNRVRSEVRNEAWSNVICKALVLKHSDRPTAMDLLKCMGVSDFKPPMFDPESSKQFILPYTPVGRLRPYSRPAFTCSLGDHLIDCVKCTLSNRPEYRCRAADWKDFEKNKKKKDEEKPSANAGIEMYDLCTVVYTIANVLTCSKCAWGFTYDTLYNAAQFMPILKSILDNYKLSAMFHRAC